jgi:hypothetical protein
MGIVVRFPKAHRLAGARLAGSHSTPATIIILPVVRIERQPDAPRDGAATPNRRRKRRASRS